jgi:hypothetical protein
MVVVHAPGDHHCHLNPIISPPYFMRLENEIGSIKAGKKADFTILEQDPFSTPVTKLKDIAVWGCVFEGQKFEVPKTTSKADLSSTVNTVPEVEQLGLSTPIIG